jgi:hypothetical protein
MREVLRLITGVAAVLIGGGMAGLGLVHYSVDSPVWLLTFGAMVLVGLTLLVWGGRTVRAVLPVPRLSIAVERNG